SASTSLSTPLLAAAAAILALSTLRLPVPRGLGGAEPPGQHLAPVDPTFDPDPARRRARLEESVVDVRPQGVQRHPAVGIAFGARHLGAAEAAGDLNLHALCARAHGRGQRAFHRAPERDPVLELLGDRLRHEFGVELGTLHLADVDLDRLAGELVEVLAQRVDFAPGLADHDPRARGVDVHRHLAAALDRDVGEAGVRELADDVVADLEILGEDVGEVFLVEPVRLPVVDVADAEPARMDLLSHLVSPLPGSGPRRCGWFACGWASPGPTPAAGTASGSGLRRR